MAIKKTMSTKADIRVKFNKLMGAFLLAVLLLIFTNF